jgi:hypothetical protein
MRDGCGGREFSPRLGVMHRESRPPLEVADERSAELRILRKTGVVGRQAHQRGETVALLGCDREVAVVGDHVFVAAELGGVATRPAEDFSPPGGYVVAMLLRDAAREEWAQQLIRLNAVVEGVDEPPDGGLAAGPLEEARLRG